MADISDQLIKVMLEQLDRRIPTLVEESPGIHDFWRAFAALAEVIYQTAHPDDHVLVGIYMSDSLMKHDIPMPHIPFAN